MNVRKHFIMRTFLVPPSKIIYVYVFCLTCYLLLPGICPKEFKNTLLQTILHVQKQPQQII